MVLRVAGVTMRMNVDSYGTIEKSSRRIEEQDIAKGGEGMRLMRLAFVGGDGGTRRDRGRSESDGRSGKVSSFESRFELVVFGAMQVGSKIGCKRGRGEGANEVDMLCFSSSRGWWLGTMRSLDSLPVFGPSTYLDRQGSSAVLECTRMGGSGHWQSAVAHKYRPVPA